MRVVRVVRVVIRCQLRFKGTITFAYGASLMLRVQDACSTPGEFQSIFTLQELLRCIPTTFDALRMILS